MKPIYLVYFDILPNKHYYSFSFNSKVENKQRNIENSFKRKRVIKKKHAYQKSILQQINNSSKQIELLTQYIEKDPIKFYSESFLKELVLSFVNATSSLYLILDSYEKLETSYNKISENLQPYFKLKPIYCSGFLHNITVKINLTLLSSVSSLNLKDISIEEYELVFFTIFEMNFSGTIDSRLQERYNILFKENATLDFTTVSFSPILKHCIKLYLKNLEETFFPTIKTIFTFYKNLSLPYFSKNPLENIIKQWELFDNINTIRELRHTKVLVPCYNLDITKFITQSFNSRELIQFNTTDTQNTFHYTNNLLAAHFYKKYSYRYPVNMNQAVFFRFTGWKDLSSKIASGWIGFVEVRIKYIPYERIQFLQLTKGDNTLSYIFTTIDLDYANSLGYIIEPISGYLVENKNTRSSLGKHFIVYVLKNLDHIQKDYQVQMLNYVTLALVSNFTSRVNSENQSNHLLAIGSILHAYLRVFKYHLTYYESENNNTIIHINDFHVYSQKPLNDLFLRKKNSCKTDFEKYKLVTK